MNLILRYIIAASVALSALGAAAQTTRKLPASKANEYALVYSLPVTSVDITIAADKTVETPGEFALYAKKYLNVAPILSQSVRWTLNEAVITPVATADPDERYAVTLKGGNGTYITVNEQNIPVSINDEEYRPSPAEVNLPVARKAEPTILDQPVARQAQTEEMLQSRSSVKRAEFAAAKIYELRNNRNEVVSGQADAMPSDGNAMKIALSTIDSQEEALTAMFTGTRSVSTEVAIFHVELPEATEVGISSEKIVVARISATEGIVPADDLSGAPVYLTVTPLSVGTMPVNEKGEELPFPKGGVAYRIPGSARLTLTYDGRNIYDTTIDVAQYGIVYGVDPSLFTNKKAPSYARFNPLTGAIVEIGEIH